MKMFINIMGVGASLPKVGFNVATASYIGVVSGGQTTLYGIQNCFSLGNKGGTLIFGWIKTKNFLVSPANYSWAGNFHQFIGQTVDVEVTGTLIANGTVDVKISLADRNNNIKSILSKANIESVGMQATATKVRGKLIKLPKEHKK